MNAKKRGSAWLLLLIYAVYFLYYFEDMETSANTMVKQTESRDMVHIYLIVLIAMLGVYFLTRGKWRLDDGFRSCFFLMIGWCIITDLIVGAAFWGIATHIGLLTLHYLIYYFGGHYIDSLQRYRTILALEFILWCVTLWYAISALLSYREYMGEEADVVLNMAYNMLVFIPILLQLKNRVLKGVSVAISVIYIVVSLKRGAIISLAVMLLVGFWVFAKGKDKDFLKISLKTATKFVVVAVALAVVVAIVNNIMGGALAARFSWEELQDGSNRSRLYAAAWADIKVRNPLQFLIGKGSGSSLRDVGSGIHNEELEFLFSYGAIGLVLYVLTMCRGVGRANKLRKEDSHSGEMYAMGITYLICVGVVSSALFSHMSFHIMLAMGLANSPSQIGQKRSLNDGQSN